MQLFSMKYSRADTGPSKDIFSWRSRVEDGNLPLCWCGCRVVSLGGRGQVHRLKLLAASYGNTVQALTAGTDRKWQDRSCFCFMHSHSSSFLHSVHWCSRKQLLILILHMKSRGMFLLIPKYDAKKSAGLPGRSAPWLGTSKWLDSDTRKRTLEQGTLKVTAWEWGQPLNTLQDHFI